MVGPPAARVVLRAMREVILESDVVSQAAQLFPAIIFVAMHGGADERK